MLQLGEMGQPWQNIDATLGKRVSRRSKRLRSCRPQNPSTEAGNI